MQINKRFLRIGAVVLGVIVVILIALPLFIDVNSLKPKIESELTNAVGRPVTLGKLSLSILSGSVAVQDVSIADDPAFSKSPFITAKSLKVGVELLPLIFSKQLNITRIVLEEPQITLLKSGRSWNFSSIGGASAKTSKSGGSPNVSIAKLQIKNGKVVVGTINSSSKPQTYENVNAGITNFSFKSQFPFELTSDLPGGGDAKVSGKAGPINPADASKTPVEATLKVKGMDLARSGFVDPASGMAGSVHLEATLNSNGKQAKMTGNLEVEKFKLSPKGTPAPKPVTMKYAIDADLDREAGSVTEGNIALGKALAKLTGAFQTQGESKVLNMKLSAPDMSVDELESFLPAMGITLPSGSQLKGGTLSAELAITGPLEKMVVSGPVRLSNTRLAGFDMGEKLGALSAFAGRASSSGGSTTIQNASLNARIAPEMTRADSINITVPSLGVVTGAGTISPAGALDFRMKAELQAATSLVSLGGKGTGGIPFMIQGTTSNPHFVPDVAGLAAGAVQSAISGQLGGKQQSNPVNALTGLFGKKQK